MEKTKKPKIAKTSQICFFGGIALCLLSVIFIMNIGAPARLFTIAPSYLFGVVSYLFYICLFTIGIILIFKEKPIKFKLSYRIFAYVLLFIAILMIATITATKKDINNNLFELISSGENSAKELFKTYAWQTSFVEGTNYFKEGRINQFSFPYGGGLVGYAIVQFFQTKLGGKSASTIFAVIFIIAAIAIIAVPIILTKYNSKEKKPKEVKSDNILMATTPYEERPIYQKPIEQPKRVNNFDSISNADQIGNDYRSEIEGAPLNEPMPRNQFIGVNNDTFGNFVPSHFYREQQRQVVEQANASTNYVQSIEPEHVDPVEQMMNETRRQNQMEMDYAGNYNSLELNNQPRVEEAQSTQVQPQIISEPIQQRMAFDPSTLEPQREDPTANYQTILPTSNKPYQDPVMEVKPQPKPQAPKPQVKWIPPSVDLLKEVDASEAIELNKSAAEQRSIQINQAFDDFHVDAQIVDFTIGPSVTRYNVQYGSHTSARAVRQAVEDIAIRLGGISARFEAIVEGSATSGIEIPNAKITTVGFKEVFEALPDAKKHPLAVAFGKNIEGRVIYADMDEFPHALIAGTTGSGKSVFVNSLICSLIMRNSPDTLRMVLIDPKKVEFGKYKEMPHLLCKIINNAVEAKNLMFKLVDEMESRYEKFENSPHGATNIKEYNADCEKYGGDKLPYIVVVIDEYADLVDQCKDIAMPVCSLAQKARACGIHILLATQRPSVNVVNGVLKGNLPTHVALSCASYTDSQVVIGEAGAEKLLGKGDMLVQSPLVSRVGVVRLQSCYIDREEISRLVGYLKLHYVTQYDEKYVDLEDKIEEAGQAFAQSPEFKSNAEGGEEAKYQEIKDWVMAQEYMSISRIQRECGVGFNRAGRFFLRMQEEGVVAKETEGNKGCPVLMQNKFGDADEVQVSSLDYTEIGEGH